MSVKRLIDAVSAAESATSIPTADSDVLTGFSGTKLVGALQNLAKSFESDPTACYVEVGVFQGLTLLSVATAAPSLPCYGIDNFAFFDPESQNLGIVEHRRRRLGATNAHLINMDYEDALEELEQHLDGRSIGVYFIDGPHDYRSQLMCLQLALPYLHPNCAIVIDDSNYRHVRQANRDFLVTHPEFRLLFEAYTRCHPGNMDPSEEASARAGWWNGVNIIVRDPMHDLVDIVPPTHRSRHLYEQEHITQTASVAEHADLGIAIVSAIDECSTRRFLRSLAGSARDLRRTRQNRVDRFASMNTFSEELPGARLNPRAQEGRS